jgi:ubiquinone/menaquinone biosynthesis C-methylase UbiE
LAADIPWLKRMQDRIRPDGERPWWKGLESELLELVRAHDRPTLVDIGCGMKSTIALPRTPGMAPTIGIDMDPDAARNPAINCFIQASAEALPLRSGSVDFVMSSYMLEHVANPSAVLREFARILRPGCTAVFWTSNRLNYAIAISALTPTRFHNWVRRLTQPEQQKDNCDTLYRMNTPDALVHGIAEAGLMLKGPLRFASGAYLYFGFSKVLFTLAALASRIARHTPLRRCKAVIIAICAKPGAAVKVAPRELPRAHATAEPAAETPQTPELVGAAER